MGHTVAWANNAPFANSCTVWVILYLLADDVARYLLGDTGLELSPETLWSVLR